MNGFKYTISILEHELNKHYAYDHFHPFVSNEDWEAEENELSAAIKILQEMK